MDYALMKAALCGFGVVSALGSGLEPLVRAIGANSTGLRVCPAFHGKGYQSTVAGWIPAQTLEALERTAPERKDDRVFLLAQEAMRQCTTDIEFLLPKITPERQALLLSTTKAGINALETRFHGEPCSAEALRHIRADLLTADLAADTGVRGPVQCVSVACISGLLAIEQGASLIQRGLADLVYVVGVDLLSHFVLAGFTSLKSLDPEGCRPFDKARVGLSLGEAGAAAVLLREDLAGENAPVVSGWGTSNDANHLTGPSRDGSGLASAISRALGKAACQPADIDYIHLHGTGTPYNDAMESLAVRRVFGEDAPPVGSSKGMLGHTLGAAGVIETILCVLAMQGKMLPGTPRLSSRDPVAPTSVLSGPRPVEKLNRILKVSCWFGGTNSALVLERRPE